MYAVSQLCTHCYDITTHMTDTNGLTQTLRTLDDLTWVNYKGIDWTLARGIDTPDRKNHYFNKRQYLVGEGLELVVRGQELADYKAAHSAATGEVLKAPVLVLIDKARAQEYLDYRYPSAVVSQDDLPTMMAPPKEVVTTTNPPRWTTTGDTSYSVVLQELARITEDKNLHWVTYKGEAYLPMREASIAKGVEKDDYSSNWVGGALPGKSLLLRSDELQQYKQVYISMYGAWPYPRTSSLCVGDWEHAYSYLVQGKSPTATTFQSMGAESIKTVATTQPPQSPAGGIRCPETWTSEERLVDRVFKLMELSTISMQREACLINTLGNTPTTRRVDAIEHLEGGRTHIYEFKKTAITAADVTATVGVKGYVHLVRERWPESKVCLFMVANGVDPQAQRLLDSMVGVMYLPLYVLLNRIVGNIMDSWPREGHYQLRTHFLSQYSDILPPELLAGPVPQPQLKASYRKPLHEPVM